MNGKKNLENGKVKIWYENGNIECKSVWINDKFDGYGKYIFENGDYYIGEMKNL